MIAELFFGFEFEPFSFKPLRFGIVGRAAARAFFCTVATAFATAALALAYGCVDAAAKIIGSCPNAQYDDYKLGIHCSPSCSR